VQDVEVHVYHLAFAEAEPMAELLKSIEYVPVEEKKATQGKDAASSEELPFNVVADKATNSLLITCPKWRWSFLQDVIKELDVVRPQVLVEVLIAEIDVSRARELGLDFNFMDTDSDEGTRPFAIGNADHLEDFLSTSGVSNGLNIGVLIGKTFDPGAAAAGDMSELSKIAVLIKALQNDSRANILSTPQLVTADNEEARISVGEQIQMPTGFNTAATSGLNSITNFSTEDLGVILEMTPRITRDDHVVLKINQTIKTRTKDTLFDFNIPVINKRELDTTITVKNNTTIVLGGLISDVETISETGIPGLSKLPLVGKLFRNRRVDKKKMNLMIFLTPHILRSEETSSMVTEIKRTELADSLPRRGSKSMRRALEAISLDRARDEGIDTLVKQIFDVVRPKNSVQDE